MTDNQSKSIIGIIGLGVMGRNLLLNIAEHGYAVAGHDKDPSKVEALHQEAQNYNVCGSHKLDVFIGMLRQPKILLMLVPAGKVVDAVINELLPFLQQGDLLIDAGNSYFKDTDLRTELLAKRGIQYLGIGISGGSEGARHGPSIMPGGSKEAFEKVRPLLEAASAKVNGDPCVTYIGKGSSGHYVKMVHNGIEYGMMQLIAETYDLLKRGLGMTNLQIHETFAEWNKKELNSYLIEIASHIFCKVDEKTGKYIIDEILDVAEQKGTGMWTSQSAMELQEPLPTIDAAVSLRNLSMLQGLRKRFNQLPGHVVGKFQGDSEAFLKSLFNALYLSLITTYAQGMALLSVASKKLDYHLNLEAVARIWRGGCIIRASVLEDIRQAFLREPDLPNLLLDPNLSERAAANVEGLRFVVKVAAELGIPLMGYMSVLGYIDAFRSNWLPANLIQAQRDYFGAHTFKRIDSEGSYHLDWNAYEDE